MVGGCAEQKPAASLRIALCLECHALISVAATVAGDSPQTRPEGTAPARPPSCPALTGRSSGRRRCRRCCTLSAPPRAARAARRGALAGRRAWHSWGRRRRRQSRCICQTCAALLEVVLLLFLLLVVVVALFGAGRCSNCCRVACMWQGSLLKAPGRGSCSGPAARACPLVPRYMQNVAGWIGAPHLVTTAPHSLIQRCGGGCRMCANVCR